MELSNKLDFEGGEVLRIGLTGFIFFPLMALFLLHGLLVKAVVQDPIRRRRLLTQNVSLYSKLALAILRMRVETTGVNPPEGEASLYVSNHLSYLDMLVLASQRPFSFVTSIDMGEVFFLGTMAEIGGSLFIERRHRERIGFDVEQIASTLRDGFDVVLFPEGTSGDGERVLPFKRSLLMAAREAGRKIVPITLRYEEIDGEPFSRANRDTVCWYGRMSFLPHFLRAMGRESVRVSIQYHQPILPREADCKDTLAKWTHRVISAAYLN